MAYIIFEYESTSELEANVNAAIEDGYRPCGGVATCEIDTGSNGRKSYFYQSMFREEESEG